MTDTDKRGPPDHGLTPTNSHNPNPREIEACLAQLERRKNRAAAPRVTVKEAPDGRVTMAVDHPDEGLGGTLLMEALATADGDFFNGLLNQLARASTKGAKADE